LKYVPTLHWEEKSSWYLKKTSLKQKLYRKQLLRIVGEQIDRYQPCRLMEVGVGPGRLFPTYKGLSDVTGIDFSWGMILRAKRTAAMMDLEVKLHKMNASCMEFSDDSFDMVVCSNVLQHIPPELISDCATEIMRVCCGVVVVIEYFEKSQQEVSDFCFLYDYPKLFEKMNLIENRKVWFERQRLFVFKKVNE